MNAIYVVFFNDLISRVNFIYVFFLNVSLMFFFEFWCFFNDFFMFFLRLQWYLTIILHKPLCATAG